MPLVNKLRCVLFFLPLLLGAGCDLPEPELAKQGATSGVMLIACSLDRTIELARPGEERSRPFVLTGDSPNHLLVEGDDLYVTCSLSNEVRRYHRRSGEELASFPCGVASNPMMSARGADGLLYVTCWLSNELLAFDTNSPTQPQPVWSYRFSAAAWAPASDPSQPTAPRPEGLLAYGNKLTVGLTNLTQQDFTPGGPSLLAHFDLANRDHPQARTLTGRNIAGLAMLNSPEPLLAAICRGSFNVGQGYLGDGLIEVLDPDSLSTQALLRPRSSGMPSAPAFAVATVGGLVISDGNGPMLHTLDTLSLSLETEALPGNNPTDTFLSALAQSPDGSWWVAAFNRNCVYVLSEDRKELRSVIRTGGGPIALAWSEE